MKNKTEQRNKNVTSNRKASAQIKETEEKRSGNKGRRQLEEEMSLSS